MTNYTLMVTPTVYLREDIGIISGNGSKDEPYQIRNAVSQEEKETQTDTVRPECSLSGINKTGEVSPDEEVEVKIKCTDDSGYIEKDITKEEISLQMDGKVGTGDINLTNSQNVEKGKEYTFTISNFSQAGILSIGIPARAVTDKAGNGNLKTTLTTGLTVKSNDTTPPTCEFVSGSATGSYSSNTYKVQFSIKCTDESKMKEELFSTDKIKVKYEGYSNWMNPTDFSLSDVSNSGGAYTYKMSVTLPSGYAWQCKGPSFQFGEGIFHDIYDNYSSALEFQFSVSFPGTSTNGCEPASIKFA